MCVCVCVCVCVCLCVCVCCAYLWSGFAMKMACVILSKFIANWSIQAHCLVFLLLSFYSYFLTYLGYLFHFRKSNPFLRVKASLFAIPVKYCDFVVNT